MRHPRVLAIVSLGLLAACAVVRDKQSATGEAHTEKQLVTNNDPHVWLDVERSTFDADFSALDEPAGGPVTTRLDAWIGLYDDVVRGMTDNLAAPRPHARVLTSEIDDAYVMHSPACITPASDAAQLAVIVTPSLAASTNRLDCVVSRSWSPESGAAWLNSLPNAYRIAPSGGGFVLTAPNGATLSAPKASFMSTLPYVHVTTGLVAALGEKATAAVIAHELGHYYRGHGSLTVYGTNNFWFDRDAPAAERPKPIENQASYEAAARNPTAPRITAIGQKYDPRIAPMLVSWFGLASPASTHACYPAKQAFDALPKDVQLELVDRKRLLSPAAATAYLAVEAKLDPCIDALVVTDEDISEFQITTNELPRRWFTAFLPPGYAAIMPPADITGRSSLRTFVTDLGEALARIDGSSADFEARLHGNHIGRYTDEQEADEIAVELAAHVGLSPDDVIAGFEELMFAVEKLGPAEFLAENGISAADCQALRKAGFGSTYVPLGDLDDPHHSFCYRIFNITRERDVHQYQIASPSAPPPNPSWEDIQAEARKLIATIPQAQPPLSEDGGLVDSDFPSADDILPDAGPHHNRAPTSPSASESTSSTSTSSIAAKGGSKSSSSCVASPAPAGTGGSLLFAVFAIASLLRKRARSDADAG